MRKIIKKNKLKYLYHVKYLSAVKIARIYRCSSTIIYYWLNKYNIKIRLSPQKISQKINSLQKKKCRICGKIKRLSKFYRRNGYCKDCHNRLVKQNYIKNRKVYEMKRKKYYQLNKKIYKQYHKLYRIRHWKKRLNSWLLTKYNINIYEYYKMLKRQKGRCYICHKKNKNKKRLGLDHNHKTKRIRHLLCNNCNTLLGLAKENIRTLQNAINYLKEKND